jgi:hypothetical protein
MIAMLKTHPTLRTYAKAIHRKTGGAAAVTRNFGVNV